MRERNDKDHSKTFYIEIQRISIVKNNLGGKKSKDLYYQTDIKLIKTVVLDFSGGPKVKTPSFHCRGCGFHSRSGNFHMTQYEVKKKKVHISLKKKKCDIGTKIKK